MFDKYRSQKQSSAFKRQRRPPAQTAHLSQHKPFSRRSTPTRAGSTCTHSPSLGNGLVEVL